MAVTQEDAEALRAMGFRAERSLLDGPRVVLDLDGVYITLVPADISDNIHWDVWHADTGDHMHGGFHADAVIAATQAKAWVEENWA